MNVEFTPRALADLRGILEYIAQDKPQAAQRFVSLLEEQCHRLARFPSVGTVRNDLLPSLRVLSPFVVRAFSSRWAKKPFSSYGFSLLDKMPTPHTLNKCFPGSGTDTWPFLSVN